MNKRGIFFFHSEKTAAISDKSHTRGNGMRIDHAMLAFLGALLLTSCSNPYFSMDGSSQFMIDKDIRFLEKYRNTLCNIKETHEREEITSGRCLALYYDQNQSDDIEKETMQRVGYILAHPGKFDKKIAENLSTITTDIVDCTNYINTNCL
jgi:hypothetical protein